MKRTLIPFLIVGVPGMCFLIAGMVSHEYPIAVLGGVMIIVFVYGLSRQQITMVPASDHKRSRLSFGLAGIIGMSLAINGFVGHQYWLVAAGVVILIGSLLQLYRTTLSDEH
jgi:hypothetical protein